MSFPLDPGNLNLFSLSPLPWISKDNKIGYKSGRSLLSLEVRKGGYLFNKGMLTSTLCDRDYSSELKNRNSCPHNAYILFASKVNQSVSQFNIPCERC